MFNRNSGLVAIWVRLINSGLYTEKKVPKLQNLQTVVHDVLKGEK